MRYRIVHQTTYDYTEPVTVSHNLVHLKPRDTARQRLVAHELTVAPLPAASHLRTDWFGNAAERFTVQERHQRLCIKASSTVEVEPGDSAEPVRDLPWETVVGILRRNRSSEVSAAVEFAFASPRIPLGEAFAEYARRDLTPERPLAAAALALTQRIHREFQYDPKATAVGTPVEQVLALRRGVCQDFAQVQLSCLRSLGLAARYVSGYLETDPPPGQVRLQGADASHAWVAVFLPGHGWIDLDPTNGCRTGARHVTVAWGRDFTDVSPMKGVILGGGSHAISVAVDVVAES